MQILFFILYVCVLSVSTDCPTVIKIAASLKMNIQDPTIYAELLLNCCAATGVFCTEVSSVDRVFKIQWNYLKLNGYFNNTALPNLLTSLDVSNNQITGVLPSGPFWPATLVSLYLNSNYLYGPIPTLPPSLKHLKLSLIGDVGNHFNGTLLLNAPNAVFIADNYFTNLIIQDATNLDSYNCDVSNNPLLNRISPTAASTACTHGTLYATVSPNNACASLVLFARELNLNVHQPLIWAQLNINCCLSNGVMCANSSQNIRDISWVGMSLDGTINGTLIPINLKTLNLQSNALDGPFPTFQPAGNILRIDLGYNQLSGPIPTLPFRVTELYASGNSFTGSLPTLPDGFTGLDLSDNSLSGNLPIFPITLNSLCLKNNHVMGTLALQKPNLVSINENLITDIIITDTSGLTNCDISNNPLLGNIRLSNLTMCTQNNLFSAAESALERQNIISFANGLNMHLLQPEIMADITTNPCLLALSLLRCNSNHFAISIVWRSLGLNGTILGIYIPKYLDSLDLWSNAITGSVPNSLPMSLKTLILNLNKLSGDLPSQFPSSLNTLWLSGNLISGTLTLLTQQMLNLRFRTNYITDVVIADTSKLRTSNCDVSYNPLQGSAHLQSLINCTQLGLYSANSLPNTKSTMKQGTTTQVSQVKISKSSVANTISISGARSGTKSESTLNRMVLTTADVEQASISIELLTSLVFDSQIDTIILLNQTDATSMIAGIKESPSGQADTSTLEPNLIFVFLSIGGLFALCVVVFIFGKLIKDPKMNSKFGRKNSFGTLNTVNTVESNK